MKEKTGKIFSISKDNPYINGCTISKSIYNSNGYAINYFSLAKDTDISAETYEYYKFCIIAEGEIEAYSTNEKSLELSKNDIMVLPIEEPVGMRTKTGCIYTEISLKKESNMNKILEAGKVIKLADLVPYQEDKIVNMDLINDSKLKFVVMSFDKGTGLTEHSAPGEALIFALDGEAVIGYEGKEYTIKAGENFKFAKNGKHFVNAKTNFKMALLLTIE